MTQAAQDFWLNHLGQAQQFNDWVFSRFRRHLGRNILEIGCGSGNFTVLMAASGYQVTGCDIHAPYVAEASGRLAPYVGSRAILADATVMDFGHVFDTVVLLDVLEHVRDDIGLLRRLREILPPGGRLILKVPAFQLLYCNMDRAIGHFRRYSRASLRRCLREAGFEIVEQGYFNIAAMAGWFLNGVVLGRTTPPEGQIDAFERLVPFLRRFERICPLPLGASLIATAAVPSI